jgi:tRNA nucleotidyltransferase (CCA-adding enzyme)
MSDYIYMLESHLSPDQARVVEQIQAAAALAGVNLFLTGGAMRDMLAGLQIRDLDFVVEGNALKVAKLVVESTGAKILASDEARKSADLLFPAGVTAQVAMSRLEKHGRPGSKPHISPATIQEDLRGRDFTCNAISLSLNRASRGLLLDPMNGIADIERRELRVVGSYAFYDNPVRMLRLTRFRTRLGFTVEERTQGQMVNAREAGVETAIAPRALGDELRAVGTEDKPSEIVSALQQEDLLKLFSPALTGPKLNLPGLAKLEKIFKLLPDEPRWRYARFGPFLYALTEKLSPKERQALVKATELTRAEIDLWQKLETRSKKLETALRSARIRKPSQVWDVVAPAHPDEVILLLYRSALKPVQERLRTYFQKYLPAIQEITPEEWAAVEGKPGTPRHEKARAAFIGSYLDRRPRKPAPVEAPPDEPAPEPPAGNAARRARP